MSKSRLNQKEVKQIDDAVALFKSEKHLFENFVNGLTAHLTENSELSPYIHFIKSRVKDSDHLRKKIERKALERKRSGKKPNINKNNLFTEITDLAGIRILHLHTEQIKEINRIILSMLEKQQYPLIEGPKAVCWDVEYKEIFEKFGISADTRESMYISVHYIIKANQKSYITAELQVRTLMEEVWGEVSHLVNYPDESEVQSCRDQLNVLARFTSGCTRLVDSIFDSSKSEKQKIEQK